MSYVVVDRTHDVVAGIYRLVIGVPVYDDQPLADGNGQPLMRCSECSQVIHNVLTSDTPAWDGHSSACSREGQAGDELATESVLIGHGGIEDFVFAADDEQWIGKTDAEIAAKQVESIRGALDARSVVAEHMAASAAGCPLPGAGMEV